MPREELFSESPLMRGDINGDGQVDLADVLCLTQYLAGKRTLTDRQKQAGDLDGDGEITEADVRILMRMCLD